MTYVARDASIRAAIHAALCAGIATLAAVQSHAAAEFANYAVVFDATWSADTHPEGFPPGPHFSGLIGGTHSARVVFWEVGGLASDGIELMAELGAQGELAVEVQDSVSAGDAGNLVSGGGIGRSPGSVRVEFRVDRDHPLLTLVSMIAPSPDWFVGIDRFALFDDDQWVDRVIVELHAYDAGTDSGPTYISPNANTVPREPIARITTPPFQSATSLGTYTLVRLPEPGPHPRLISVLTALAVAARRRSVCSRRRVRMERPCQLEPATT